MSMSVLLNHLQDPHSKAPLQTIVAALAHNLVVGHVTPTPLAAAAVSSPLYLSFPLSHEKLQGLVTAFRHAVHAKHEALVKKSEEGWSLSRAVFSKGVDKGLDDWLKAALHGLHGGRAIARLACYSGLLLGVHGIKQISIRIERLEDETIVALAEVLDEYKLGNGEWEKQFHPSVDESSLPLALVLASQSMLLIPESKLKVLPLSLLATLLTSTIVSAFQNGDFLNGIPEASSSRLFYVPPDSAFAQNVRDLATASTIQSMAGLSRLLGKMLGILIESKNTGVWDARNSFEKLLDVAGQLERGWGRSRLWLVDNEDELSLPTRGFLKTIWLLLKTFLFTTVMVAQSVFDNLVYTRPKLPQESEVAPQTLARLILTTFSNISFVVSQFGGVTTTADSDEPGFTELRKVFYLALDILSTERFLSNEHTKTSALQCEDFVKNIITGLSPGESKLHPECQSGIPRQAKIAYALACVEQLVPLLSESFLEGHVWEICIPHLSDPSYRETYESAHSVVLTIFASHIQRLEPFNHQANVELMEYAADPRKVLAARESANTVNRATISSDVSLVHRMIPYYAECLIENSTIGKLNTAQLKLAYASLVKCASVSRSTTPSTEAHALGWYCISLILDKIRQLSVAPTVDDKEHLHRLNLTLISTISSLPLPLLIRVVEDIRAIITGHPTTGVVKAGNYTDGAKRMELVDALFSEILDGAGDMEMQPIMEWWHIHEAEFFLEDDDLAKSKANKGLDGAEKNQSHASMLSRL